MLNTKSIEKALQKYASYKDPRVVAGLEIGGPLMLAAAGIRESLDRDVPEWTDEEIRAAVNGGTPLLKAQSTRIDGAEFTGALERISEVFFKALRLEGEELSQCQSIDWSNYATESLLTVASQDPEQYFEALRVLTEDENLFDDIVMPVVGYGLLAFLDEEGVEATKRINKLFSDTVHMSASLRCPVCNGSPSLAYVAGTTKHGNAKRLCCGSCGASWLFERIRCAYCGTQDVSDLEYVQDEGDDVHRLHVCKSCGGAMPTVFATEESQVCPEVEGVVLMGLADYYSNNKEDELKA